MMRIPLPAQFVLALAVLTAPVGAQTPGDKDTSAPLAASMTSRPDAAEIRARIAELEADTTIDVDLKASLVDLYRRALDLLQTEEQERERARALAELVADGASKTGRLREEIAALNENPVPPRAADAPQPDTAALSRRQMEAQTALASLRGAAADLEAKIRQEEERPNAARAERAAADEALAKVAKAISQPVPINEAQALYNARMAVLSARERRRQAEITRLDQEIVSHDLRMEILRLERDKIAAELKSAQDMASDLERQIINRRQTEAASAQVQAERRQVEAEAKNPVLGEAAGVNAELTREQNKIAADIERMAVERQRIADRAAQIEKDAANTAKRVDLAGVSEVLGRYLRDQRARLGNMRKFERETALRQDEIAALSLRQIEVSEQLQALERPDQAAYALFLASTRNAPAPSSRETLLEELRLLLVERRRILEDVSSAYSNNLRAISELEFEQQHLAAVSADYARFLDERLLWVPSSRALGGETLTIMDMPAAFAWLVSPAAWQEAALALFKRAKRNIAATVFLVIIVGGLIALRGRLRRRIDDIDKKIARVQTDGFAHTVEAFVITVVIAATLPTALAIVGWALRDAVTATEFTRAIGAGALDAALVLGVGSVIIQLCQPRGIAASHFKWSANSLTLIRRHLTWWLTITVPAVFLISMLDWQSNPAFNDSLGRYSFIVQAIALMVFAYSILHPKRGLPARYLLQHRDGWVFRLRSIWFGAAFLFPAALIILAGGGFYFTATSLENRLVATAVIVIAATLTYNFCLRWLQVTRRRLEYELARQKRASDPAQQNVPAMGGETGASIVADSDRPDIGQLNDQTLHLLKVVIGTAAFFAIYLAWADVLPALTVLSDIELWRYTGEIDGQPATVPVTLQGILLVLVVTVLITVAAKNLPAALEIAILQQLPIDAGLRYAIKTVSQYVIVAAGFIYILSGLGVGWSNIQWLVAALSVGLGFGLQEIVANFVSGLIILFERPIRIGDVVTVGDATGTVTKVRIRATTLRDFDNKELIVPNKTFITDRLVNWSLSDAIVRVVIPIGIAYGSDVELAKQVIVKAAKDIALVLDEPPLRILFRGFGDSSLDLELFVYVRTPTDRLIATDQLLPAIYAALAEAGIEIPFPQRDLHLRDIDRLDAAISSRAARPRRSAGTGPAETA